MNKVNSGKYCGDGTMWSLTAMECVPKPSGSDNQGCKDACASGTTWNEKASLCELREDPCKKLKAGKCKKFPLCNWEQKYKRCDTDYTKGHAAEIHGASCSMFSKQECKFIKKHGCKLQKQKCTGTFKYDDTVGLKPIG